MSRSANFYKIRNKYTVSAVCEFFKELEIYALDESEAREFYEERMRARHKAMARNGFVLGDIDFIDVKRH